jgi:hypothetical protein
MTGFGRRAEGTAEAGNFSFGRAREREKAPLAERCFPYRGFCIAAIVVECAPLVRGIFAFSKR